MSKSPALRAAEAKIIALEAQVKDLTEKLAARDARIEVAKTVFRDQRAKIAGLESALNTRGVKPAAPAPATKITYFMKAGVRWMRTQNGKFATSHPVQ